MEWDDAALHEFRGEGGVQPEHVLPETDQFDLGAEPLDNREVEALRECGALVLGRGDLVANRLRAEPRQRDKTREFRLGGAGHCPPASPVIAAARGGSPNETRPASKSSASCSFSRAASRRT